MNTFLKEAVSWILVIIAALIITLIIQTFAFQMVVVEGDSMIDTLHNGDRLGVVKLFYTPKQGDIVVLYPNGNKQKPFIKRIIATGGQTIDIKDSRVYVDGVELTENYLGSFGNRPGEQKYPLVVPENEYFVMGDNRDHSLDSRTFSVGTVKREYIAGRAAFRIFPFDRIHLL